MRLEESHLALGHLHPGGPGDVRPGDRGVHHDGEYELQRGHDQGSQQGDEEVQVGNSGGQHEGEAGHRESQEVLQSTGEERIMSSF